MLRLPPLSLYVHIPFCRHACWYCGCNRITTQAGSKVVGPYLRALGRELGLIQQASGQRRRLGQLHWGGGTPNYLSVAEQAELWALIERCWTHRPDERPTMAEARTLPACLPAWLNGWLAGVG